MALSERMLAELRALGAKVDHISERLEAAEKLAERHALKRADAARAIGVSVKKLAQLIKAKRIRTAADVHLVPMSEIRRYTAPKMARKRKPAVGYRAMRRSDGQSDEAIYALEARLRSKRAAR